MDNAGLRRTRPFARPLAWLAALVLSTFILARIGRDVIPVEKVCPDFICYWAAGKILLSGQSPYDVALQARVQREQGWDKVKNGLGIYDFLPYYYPPWFGLVCAPLVPLGYPTAKITWLVVNAELLLLTGYLLRNAVAGVPRSIPPVIVPTFALSVASLILGQTSPLIFFVIVAAWRLLEGRRDGLAGSVLAWLTIKPQLTAVLLVGVLLWAWRRGRWKVIAGFAATLCLLGLASFAVVPAWPAQMLWATRRTPPPTEYFPWIGTTWFLLLKGAGLRTWGLWASYAVVALPFTALVLATAMDRGRPLRDVLSLGLLTAFFVAPYGRHYDFPVLLIPFLVMAGGRLAEWSRTALVIVLLVIPYFHYIFLNDLKSIFKATGSLNPEFTFFWVPLLLTVVWFVSGTRISKAEKR